MITKGDIVNTALRWAGIASSGSLLKPKAQAVDNSLFDLEDLMALLDGQGIRLGYMFADPDMGPLPDDDSGLPDWSKVGICASLAEFMLMSRDMPVTNGILMRKSQGMDVIQANTHEVPMLVRRNDMPTGAGHKFNTTGRFYIEPASDDPLETEDGDTIVE